jgi:hypothetical protein
MTRWTNCVAQIDVGRAEHLGYNEANADVAQLVERDLAKVEVAGSSPVVRSSTSSSVAPNIVCW